MFKSFINWLDSYISREEPSSVLKAMVGLMAFAGLLGTIFGKQSKWAHLSSSSSS